ncbi:hypothetical protein GGX14DRAFT_540412 [Mycena pura]|uniref:Uncharacterized protein n=1 Tax=Mycena pura TaxID=153505 RepID=A0AAD6YL03_9AGAR|nr:hypothetical protein GGX14DRAFT_540412 [Mycena pura]
MANWLDVIALLVTVAVFGGIVYVVLLIVRSVSQGVESAKEGLKTKGLHITDKGVAVKTSKRFDREDYVDATQRCVRSTANHRTRLLTFLLRRGIVRAVGAASFRKGGAAEPGYSSDGHLSPSSPSLKSSSSASSIGSVDGEKKHRHLFKKTPKDQ